MEFNTPFKIRKCDKIFLIGDIDCNFNFFKIINLGLKYIPNFTKVDLYLFFYF